MPFLRLLWCFYFLQFCFFLLWGANLSAQTCTTELYTKDFNVGSPRGEFLFVLPGGGTIFGGRGFSSISEVGLIKTTPGGTIVFNKRINGFGSSGISTACLTINKNILIGSRENLVLVDTNGVVLNSAVTSVSYGEIFDLKMDQQGNFYALYNATGAPANQSYVVTKLASDLSTVLWSVSFGTDYSCIYRSILVDDNKVFAVGSFPTSQGSKQVGSVLCFNSSNGAVLNQVSLLLDGFECTMMKMHKTNNGYVLTGFYLPYGTTFFTQNHVIVRLNNALQPVKAVRLTGILNTEPLYIETDGHDGYYGSAKSPWISFFHCDQNDSTTSSWLVLSSGMGLGSFAMTSSNLYALDQYCWVLSKADLNGHAGGCNETTIAIGSVPIIPATTQYALTPKNSSLSISSSPASVVDSPFTIMRDCKAISSCTSLHITGPTNICSNGTSIVYTGSRNPGCRLPVQWNLNGSPANQKLLNDSTLSINFISSGSYQLIATLPSDCMAISDTINVNVSLSNAPLLNLGPDQSLCLNNTILLHAGNGYKSYLWQDGSIDSIFTVKHPGLYFVTTIDACGGINKDSVTITAAPPILFNAGPDRIKCNNDTLHFNAPGGFLNYSWSPAYNLSSTSQASLVASPEVDTTYFIKAEKTVGCFAYDTIHVTVYHSPKIDLGPDKNFCSGDSITLDAGNGFNLYVWNNITGMQTKMVYTAGAYTVIGTTVQGCRSYDTIVITNVWQLPQVGLDKNSYLCTGTSRILNAGNFLSYRWQDGSTSSTYVANTTGKYYVQVVDKHNCVGSDTTNITTILPLPKDFLPSDTSLCAYSKMELKTNQNFSSYLWDNGSRAANITVDLPGLYWLQVTDSHGCLGNDSITINPKQCVIGLYIPTAFTPNSDFKNDVFRAMVFGVVKNFELTIYNRWGQAVFYTTDFKKGWDGKVSGREQDSGVFIWKCRYQLEGEAEKLQQGTVMLIR